MTSDKPNSERGKRKPAPRREIEPSEPLAKLGPKMLALNERQQKFVISLFLVKQGHGMAVRAARASGWGTPASSPQSMATIASRLMHSDAIIEAMREYGEQFLKAAGPTALRALEKLILTPGHKGHERAVSAVVDRLYPIETVLQVKHAHDVTPNAMETARIMERIAELSARFAVGLPAPARQVAGPIIDGEATLISQTGGGQ